MSFFSEEDRAARNRATHVSQRSELEQRTQAKRVAREKLEGTLKRIKSSYASGSRGVVFSFDHTPFVGPYRPDPSAVNHKFMVEELARLIEKETGLRCELDEDNNASIARLDVSFS